MNEYMKTLLAKMKAVQVDATRLGFVDLADEMSERIAKLRAQNDPDYRSIDIQDVLKQGRVVMNRGHVRG